MSRPPPPVIGQLLYGRLEALTKAARTVAVIERNYHAMALYIVLEALRAQAEDRGTHVQVFVAPIERKR